MIFSFKDIEVGLLKNVTSLTKRNISSLITIGLHAGISTD